MPTFERKGRSARPRRKLPQQLENEFACAVCVWQGPHADAMESLEGGAGVTNAYKAWDSYEQFAQTFMHLAPSSEIID